MDTIDIYVTRDIISYTDTDTKIILSSICQNYPIIRSIVGIENIIVKNNNFKYGCEINSMLITRNAIRHGETDWNKNLLYASECGSFEIAKLMIDKGATHIMRAFPNACIGGNVNVAKLLRQVSNEKYYGFADGDVYDWNDGLIFACKHNNNEMISYLIEIGATNCNHCNKSMREHLEKMKKMKN